MEVMGKDMRLFHQDAISLSPYLIKIDGMLDHVLDRGHGGDIGLKPRCALSRSTMSSAGFTLGYAT